MELHISEGVCFEEDSVLSVSNEMENSSNGFEKWLQKGEYIATNKGNLISVEMDPLLSEAQDFDRPTYLEAFELISQSQLMPKKRKAKESLPSILRSVNNKTDKNMNSFKTNIDFTKNDILMSHVPYTVEMIFVHNEASLNFRDVDGNQIFLTQYMQLPDNYTHPERIQKIQSVTLVPICKELNFTLPQIITTLGAKIHLCPLLCNKAFLHIADAKLHALKHMQIKPYKCNKPDCPWEFYTACKLARHKETHLKNRHFICDIGNCKKSFSTVYNLNDHKKKHSKPADLPCPVTKCNLWFQNEKQRRAHFKSHDHTEAPFHCKNGKCTKSFFTQTLLDAHCRACLQRESEIVCKYPNCGKVFPTPYRLREHIRQHTGAKPYQCQFENCTWRFNTASKLKRHQSIHTRDRKFHCTMGDCTKSFLRSEHLKEHTLTHIEKKPVESEGKSVSLTKRNNVEKKVECAKIDVEDENSVAVSTSSDILLEQAIQSLGVPSDIILAGELIVEEPLALLENENFSTVNLRDLD